MKRCPECRRDYSDEALSFCLDDGARLLDGPGSSDEPATAILSVGNVSDESSTKPQINHRRTAGRVWMGAFAVTGVVAIALAWLLANKIGTTSPAAPLRRFVLNVPFKDAPNWNDFRVAISPDGTRIAYNCREGNAVSICLRNFDSLAINRLTEGRDAVQWFFSPDGESLGIVDEIGLSKVSIRGGEPQRLYRWLDTEDVPTGFSWGVDGYILFGTNDGIKRIAVAGGSPEVVTRATRDEGVTGHTFPSHMPDGKHALITIARPEERDSAGVVDLRDGSVRDLGVRGFGFVYVAPSWLAFRQGTTVFAVAFDPADQISSANSVPVMKDVGRMPPVASDGTLVYIPTRGESNARLVWADRNGITTAVGSDRLEYTHLDLAPDGRHALLNLIGSKIDLIDLEGGTRKLVAEGAFPVWSSNSERVTFSGNGGILWAPVDGSSPPKLLVSHTGFVVPTSWNAVTGDLAYYDHRAFEIWIRSTDGKTRKFLGAPGRKRSGRFSPDGKWMAFVSDETGDYQVYVTAYPGPGPTVAVSTKGGLSPIWSADGRELFYRVGSKVLAARMSVTQAASFEAPVELFDGPYTLDLMGHQREDIAPDGRRFLMVENSDDFPIVIVQNWALELERQVR